MTVTTTGTKTNYPMDGSTLVFAFDYSTLQATDIKASVTTDGVNYIDLVYTAGIPSPSTAPIFYAVLLNEEGAGGIVTVGNPLNSAYTLLVQRIVALTQEDDLSNYGTLPAPVLERIADKITMMAQQLQADIDVGGGGVIPEPGEGSLPDGTLGQIIVRGQFDWEAKNVDGVTIEIHSTNGIQVKDNSIGNDQIGFINGAGLIFGQSLTSLADIPAAAGLIPIENLANAPSGGGEVSGDTVYNAAAPTGFTNLDLSGSSGVTSSLVALKIKNNGATDEEYVFIMNGETKPYTFPAVATPFGGGAAGASIVAGEIAYVLLPTDGAGVVEWKCSTAVSTLIVIDGFVPLVDGEPAPPVEEGELPDAVQNQIAVKGSTEWESKNVDGQTIERHPAHGLWVKGFGIGSSEVGVISKANTVYGQSLAGLSSIPPGAGSFPAANLPFARAGGGFVVSPKQYVLFGSTLTTFTILSLTGAGVQSSISLVKVQILHNDSGNVDFTFKWPDDTKDTGFPSSNTALGGGASSVTVSGSTLGEVWVLTDNSGRTEWKSSAAGIGVAVYVTSHIPMNDTAP